MKLTQEQIKAWAQVRQRLDKTRAAKSLIGTALRMDMTLNEVEQGTYDRTYQRVLELTGDILKAEQAAIGAVYRMREGLAVKSRKVEEGHDISGWVILFGTPVHLDLVDTYFDEDTDYMLAYYPKFSPLFIEHGDLPGVYSHPIGYRIEVKVYPGHGIYMRHRIAPTQPAFDYISYKGLVADIDNGLYMHSSDSMAHHVEHGLDTVTGKLRTWPLAAMSITKTPAEPGLGLVVAQPTN